MGGRPDRETNGLLRGGAPELQRLYVVRLRSTHAILSRLGGRGVQDATTLFLKLLRPWWVLRCLMWYLSEHSQDNSLANVFNRLAMSQKRCMTRQYARQRLQECRKMVFSNSLMLIFMMRFKQPLPVVDGVDLKQVLYPYNRGASLFVWKC